MGFNLGRAITGAISGAFSGASVAGPYGAIAGGVLGGASGGFGGPTSIGGISGIRGQGQSSGREAREYYDEAFPGTNPWERLGAGNPMSSVVSAGIQAKTAQRNVQTQTSTAVKVAKIQAGGAATVAQIHAGPASRQAAASETQAASGIRGVTVREREATTGEKDAVTRRSKLLIEAERVQTEKGKAFRSPEIAALAARAVQTFDYGSKSTKEWEQHLASGWWKIYIAAGVAAHTIREGSDAVGKVLGARVRGVSARGSIPKRTSVRSR